MAEEHYEISLRQEQLWTAESQPPTGRIQPLLRLRGTVDGSQVHAALMRVIGRHELLRTTFVREPGTRVPVQVIHTELDPSWRELDLRETSPGDPRSRLEDALAEERSAPIDYVHGPMVRALFVVHGDGDCSLALTLSELHADLASVRVLAGDLLHYLTAREEPLDEPLQYADFAAWQRDLATADDDEAREGRQVLSSHRGVSPTLPFAPLAAPAPSTDVVGVELSADALGAVRSEAERAGTGDELFALATWHALLARATGQEDVVVGLCGPLGENPDLAGAIGPLGWILPVRAHIQPDTTFRSLLDGLAAARRALAEHEAHASPDLTDGVTAGFAATGLQSDLAAGDVRIAVESVAMRIPQWPLWLEWAVSPAFASARVHFDPEALPRPRAEQLAQWFVRLLAAFARHPDTPVAEPPLHLEAELDAVLRDPGGTVETTVPARVHELIADQAGRHPERTAVSDGRNAITYGDLERRANQLAHRLQAVGVSAGTTVGLCTDRSVDMVVALLGILKAGGAYLPLHPEHPALRLGAQLEAAAARALVTQAALRSSLPAFSGPTIYLDRDREALSGAPTTPLSADGAPEDLAYVIFTSGSTGAPKGVAVTHRGLAGYATDIGRRLGAGDEPLSFGLVTSISTDLGNTSVFGALCSGGQLVLVDAATAADPAQLAQQLAATPVDVLKITPSHLRAVLTGSESPVLPRRWLVVGGETLSWDLVAAVRRVSEVAIMNHYGPTEATVGCCAAVVTEELRDFDPASVPVGRPIAGAACYILNTALRPVPDGVPGRLFVGGDGVAAGYVGQPDLTDQRFLADPFLGRQRPGARMYDTGDLARRLPDGTIEFLGRVDEQVKIRGFRVEPGEIEVALRTHPGITEAIVSADAEPSGEPRLIAYYTASAPASTAELRAHLRARLPEHMVPAAFIHVDTVPRTASGKVDRHALAELGSAAAAERDHPYVAARTSTEAFIGALWQELLGVERVGVADDFFALGGHSLLAARAVAQLRAEFGVQLPPHALFLSSTVETLAGEIDRLLREAPETDLALG